MHPISRSLAYGLALAMLVPPTLRAFRTASSPSEPSAAPGAALGADNQTGPAIEFASRAYDFGQVKAGEVVHYTFVFTNTGTARLEVQRVQSSCGCTTAGEWTREVEPGQAGSIPVQFNSERFNGPVHKVVTVTSNDKQHPSVLLELNGTVWKPLDIIPPYQVLHIAPDATNAAVNVRVVNHLPEYLALASPVFSGPGFAAVVHTNDPGREYRITITAQGPFAPGDRKAKLTFQTSSTNLPIVEIPFTAIVPQPVTVTPLTVSLPQGPQKATRLFTIQNHCLRPLTLTDPAVNVPNVGVQLRETYHGKVFEVVLSFPEDFRLPPGVEAMFTAQSGNPLQPIIEVPLLPLPAQAVVTPAPPPNFPAAR